jgi:hypothetical protein
MEDQLEVPYLVYPPTPVGPNIPTREEAEDAANILLAFLDGLPEPIITDKERDALFHVRCALFQYVSGVPYVRE